MIDGGSTDATVDVIGKFEGKLGPGSWGRWQRRNFVQMEVSWARRRLNREDLDLLMDYVHWLRILSAGGKVGFIDAELAEFRLQPNQKSTQPTQTAEETPSGRSSAHLWPGRRIDASKAARFARKVDLPS
jgi:hypothetical protein